MLNKGLHSEEARSRKPEVGSRKYLLFLHLFEGEYSDSSSDSNRKEGVAHSPKLTARSSCNPKNEFAYGVNQTKMKTEVIAHQKPAFKTFLHLSEGEYSRFTGREGVYVANSIPNLPNQKILHLSEGEYAGPSQDGQREGMNSSPMQTDLTNLTTSSVDEEGTLPNNVTFKQNNDHEYFPHQGKCPDVSGKRGQKTNDRRNLYGTADGFPRWGKSPKGKGAGGQLFETSLHGRHGRSAMQRQTIINL